MEFLFHTPVKLVFGQPAAKALPLALEEIGAERVLLLSDAGLSAMGMVKEIAGLAAGGQRRVVTFDRVRTNPTTLDVDEALAVARQAEAQAIVALGGGSVIDVGKAVGLLMTNGGRYADYQWHGQPIKHPILPLVAMPTTAGTGSEMTKVAVIADHETHFKRGVLSPMMFARIAIVDPALTATLPAGLTAATGVDVLGHALEAFVGRRANPISDALALAALSQTWWNLPRVVNDGSNMDARRDMALASVMAGQAFDQSGLGLIHSLAGPLAAHYGLHHGLCVGLATPYGLAYNLPALGEKRAQLLDALFIPVRATDEQVVERVKWWARDLGLPLTLSGLEIADPDLPALAEEVSRMALLPNNPRQATAEDCQRILEEML